MASETPTDPTSTKETLSSASKLFTVGAELLREVQTHIGHTKIRSLRLTLGGRPIKDFTVSPGTAIVGVLLVIVAVVVTNLGLEVVKDTDVASEGSADASTVAAPGGAK